MQLKRHSLLETIISTAVGFIVALLTQLIVFPLYDIQTGTNQNLQIAGIFTVVSVLRGYVMRRVFNHFTGNSKEVRGKS